jgi:hypothetical protein
LAGAVVLLFIAGGWFSPFFALQTDSLLHAGTWEDDPTNWYRAFNEEPPGGVKVIHSKYWRSRHFTYEYAYYFEVSPTAEWKEAFLKKHSLERVSPANGSAIRGNHYSDLTPDWFVPGPSENYEIWDKHGYRGSVWIDKTNGHIFFFEIEV